MKTQMKKKHRSDHDLSSQWYQTGTHKIHYSWWSHIRIMKLPRMSTGLKIRESLGKARPLLKRNKWTQDWQFKAIHHWHWTWLSWPIKKFTRSEKFLNAYLDTASSLPRAARQWHIRRISTLLYTIRRCHFDCHSLDRHQSNDTISNKPIALMSKLAKILLVQSSWNRQIDSGKCFSSKIYQK